MYKNKSLEEAIIGLSKTFRGTCYTRRDILIILDLYDDKSKKIDLSKFCCNKKGRGKKYGVLYYLGRNRYFTVGEFGNICADWPVSFVVGSKLLHTGKIYPIEEAMKDLSINCLGKFYYKNSILNTLKVDYGIFDEVNLNEFCCNLQPKDSKNKVLYYFENDKYMFIGELGNKCATMSREEVAQYMLAKRIVLGDKLN